MGLQMGLQMELQIWERNQTIKLFINIVRSLITSAKTNGTIAVLMGNH